MSREKTSGSKRVLPFIIIVGVLVAAVVGGVLALRKDEAKPAASSSTAPPSSGTTATQPASSTSSAPRRESPGAQPPHMKGRQSAPVVLEEFGDYQCPPCAQIYPEVERVREEFGGRVRFVFRHYPLTRIHPHALLAAHAAESAGLQGKFWDMHRLLYENQTAWSNTPDPRPAFDAYARRLGLDAERFRRDLGGADADARLAADVGRARSVGVESTPTFFVNGRKLTAADASPAGLRSAIRRALGR